MTKQILLAVALATTANADNIGPSIQGTGLIMQSNSVYGAIPFESSLNGLEFNNQNIEYDLVFDGFFIRAYTQTQKLMRHNKGLIPDLFLSTISNPTISGTATFLDTFGQPFGNPMTITKSGNQTETALAFSAQFPFFPIDVYGIRYNLQISGAFAGPDFFAIEGQGFYGVGPGPIPTDVIPDTGNTIAMLSLALLLLFWKYQKQQ